MVSDGLIPRCWMRLAPVNIQQAKARGRPQIDLNTDAFKQISTSPSNDSPDSKCLLSKG